MCRPSYDAKKGKRLERESNGTNMTIRDINGKLADIFDDKSLDYSLTSIAMMGDLS